MNESISKIQSEENADEFLIDIPIDEEISKKGKWKVSDIDKVN